MLYATDAGSVWGEGRPVTTQSMMKTFLQCPREAYYKYVLRLQPKRLSEPLTRGKWIHSLLETYYKSLMEDPDKAEANRLMWKQHELMVSRFRKLNLFDEELEKLGNMPEDVKTIVEGYFYHYGDPAHADYNEWEVVGVEQTLEAELPNGHIFRGRFDMLVQNQFGLWLVDHKSHKRMPDWSHRMMDVQAPLYTWAAHQNGLPVKGFIWNYLITTSRSAPTLLKNGSRFSKTGWASTTYPLALQAVKDAGWIKDKRVHVPDNPEYTAELTAQLRALRDQRWAPGTAQSSPFYRRDEIAHDPEQVARVVASTVRTSERMHSYDFTSDDTVERNTVECKGWRCSYSSLSMADLVTGDSSRLKRSDYQHGDPLAYYEDEEDK